MPGPSPQWISCALQETRQRSYDLLEPLDDGAVEGQFDAILGPLIWDLGHIGNAEELWLLRALDGRGSRRPDLDRLYNPLVQPRSARGGLVLPRRRETERYVDSIRHDVLELLAKLDLNDSNRLLRDGYIYHMILQHEAQHQETILQSLDLRQNGRPYPPALRQKLPAPGVVDDEERVLVAGGVCTIGTVDTGHAYDNERPRHEVEIPAFQMDRFPVTCRRWLEFMEDGGYRRQELWSRPGREWLAASRCHAPQGWLWAGADGWVLRRFGHIHPIDPRTPVQHVCFWEAQAFANWAGARLPAEEQWEKAASWDPEAGRARLFPWGDDPPTPCHANLDHAGWGPAPVGSYPLGASAYGIEQLVGDVYQWTASEFRPYAGFSAFPYAEYSKVFFRRGYMVLRGASWAIRPIVSRNSYRNWDLPQRRQIFVGVRLVWDAH